VAAALRIEDSEMRDEMDSASVRPALISFLWLQRIANGTHSTESNGQPLWYRSTEDLLENANRVDSHDRAGTSPKEESNRRKKCERRDGHGGSGGTRRPQSNFRRDSLRMYGTPPGTC